jgi:hypothetical protein
MSSPVTHHFLLGPSMLQKSIATIQGLIVIPLAFSVKEEFFFTFLGLNFLISVFCVTASRDSIPKTDDIYV